MSRTQRKGPDEGLVAGSVCWKKQFAVPLQRIVLVLLSVVIACIAFYAVLRRRHRCAHKDPLCRRARPCIACYRELWEKVRALDRLS